MNIWHLLIECGVLAWCIWRNATLLAERYKSQALYAFLLIYCALGILMIGLFCRGW